MRNTDRLLWICVIWKKNAYGESSPSGDESSSSIGDGLSLSWEGDDGNTWSQSQLSGQEEKGDIIVQSAVEWRVLGESGDGDDLSTRVVVGGSGTDSPFSGGGSKIKQSMILDDDSNKVI